MRRKFALTRGDGFAFERGYFSWPGEHVELHGIAVADDLKAMMDSGELAPGDKLPGEAEMAELYGVSRDMIRRATPELCLASLRYAALGRAWVEGRAPACSGLTRLVR